MPRPPADTRFRRFMMQAIMWVILGATLGVAALVDRHKQHALEIRLSEPIELAGVATIRVPVGWILETDEENHESIDLKEPGMEEWGRTIEIKIERMSVRSLMQLFRPEKTDSRTIRFGDAPATLLIRHTEESHGRYAAVPMLLMSVSRELPDKRFVTLTLRDIDRDDRKELARDVDLIKKILATFKLESSPTTQEQ